VKSYLSTQWLSWLEGYFLIPHELLHVVGYRFVGKTCRYRWGSHSVTPLGTITRRERLVAMLFPFGVFIISFLSSTILTGLSYGQALRTGAFFWFGFWLVGSLVLGLYAGTTIIDLRNAYLLLTDKPWHSWTPFDIFFWPVVDWDEIRKNMSTEETDDKQA